MNSRGALQRGSLVLQQGWRVLGGNVGATVGGASGSSSSSGSRAPAPGYAVPLGASDVQAVAGHYFVPGRPSRFRPRQSAPPLGATVAAFTAGLHQPRGSRGGSAAAATPSSVLLPLPDPRLSVSVDGEVPQTRAVHMEPRPFATEPRLSAIDVVEDEFLPEGVLRAPESTPTSTALEPLPEPRVSVFDLSGEGVPLRETARVREPEPEEVPPAPPPETLSPRPEPRRVTTAFDLDDDRDAPYTPLARWVGELAFAETGAQPVSPSASEPLSPQPPSAALNLASFMAAATSLSPSASNGLPASPRDPLPEPRLSAFDLNEHGSAMSSQLLEPLPEPRVSAFDLNDEGDLPYAPLTQWAQSRAAASVLRSPRVSLEPGATCAVCLEALDDRVAQLPCNHVFHRDCVLPWLARRGTCPTCRNRHEGC